MVSPLTSALAVKFLDLTAKQRLKSFCKGNHQKNEKDTYGMGKKYLQTINLIRG